MEMNHFENSLSFKAVSFPHAVSLNVDLCAVENFQQNIKVIYSQSKNHIMQVGWPKPYSKPYLKVFS